jgi:hypothetical protein
MKAPITIWKLYNVTVEKYEHNHISSGHDEASSPRPQIDEDGKPFSSQKSWKHGKWEKQFGYLVDNKVVVGTS